MILPTLQPQEISFDAPDSQHFFVPRPDLPFVATPAALALYGDAIPRCLAILQGLAALHRGLDRLQVFTDPSKTEALWYIEDGPGGAITALLPSDY
jgi:hypothetical protein